MALRPPKPWASWLGAGSVPLVVGDPLHWDPGGPGLALRSHPRKKVGLELSQALGKTPWPQRWLPPWVPVWSFHPLLAANWEPVGWVAGWAAASPSLGSQP